ncbi:hypothetical protein E0H68_37905 [Rhizobium leguminosarum bv. viciae]|uniref:hypothetical protein n=1 Tax=Rhizobium leguminosarum TaxID=384 RepID=UPI001039296A|nr:hypothetical protein [Rhizobium leguminosarum]TCA00168.1 hypothetical protein E0H68_37905 [Rhizobium leguminosarum bv. viciae]
MFLEGCNDHFIRIARTTFFAVVLCFFYSYKDARSAEELLINKSNFTMSGIEELLKRESKYNPKYTVDCAGSWNIIWPEVKLKNPWAMLAYSVDLNVAVQNQKKFRNMSVSERANINQSSTLANMYYMNYSNKKLLSEFEDTFREIPGFPSKLHEIGRYFGLGAPSETEEFVKFAKCIKASESQSASDTCFHRLSKSKSVLKFDELMAYVDDASIKNNNDITCVR